jgi:hypothetical protein
MSTKKPEWLAEGVGYSDITLSKPASLNGVSTASVRMREPTVRDQEVASEMTGSDASREIAVFANLCGIAPDDIRELSIRDYKRLQVAWSAFID